MIPSPRVDAVAVAWFLTWAAVIIAAGLAMEAQR